MEMGQFLNEILLIHREYVQVFTGFFLTWKCHLRSFWKDRLHLQKFALSFHVPATCTCYTAISLSWQPVIGVKLGKMPLRRDPLLLLVCSSPEHNDFIPQSIAKISRPPSYLFIPAKQNVDEAHEHWDLKFIIMNSKMTYPLDHPRCRQNLS